jgi:hypothetical protein
VGARIRATEGSAGIAARMADIAGAAVAHILVRRIVGGAAPVEARHKLLVAAVDHMAAEVVVVHILAVRRIAEGAAPVEARHKLLAVAVARMAAEGVVARIPVVHRMAGKAAGPHMAGEMARRRVAGEEEHRTAEAAARRTDGEEAVAGSSLLAEGVLVRSAMAPPISQRAVSLLTAVGRVLRVRHFEEALFATMRNYSVLLGRWIWQVEIPSVGGEILSNAARTSQRVRGRGSFL